MDEAIDRFGGRGHEKLMPLFKSNNTPIHPYRVAYELNEFWRQHHLHR